MKMSYIVEWDGDLVTYRQDFETIEDARLALALHNRRNSRLIVKRNYE